MIAFCDTSIFLIRLRARTRKEMNYLNTIFFVFFALNPCKLLIFCVMQNFNLRKMVHLGYYSL